MSTIPGQIFQYLCLALVNAAIAGAILLALYRRASLRSMNRSTTDLVPDTLSTALGESGRSVDPGVAAAPPLRLTDLAYLSEPRELLAAPRRRLVRSYLVAAIAYTSVMASFHCPPWKSPLVQWVTSWLIGLWPIVPVTALVLSLDRRAILKALLLYLGFGALVIFTFTIVARVLIKGIFDDAPIANIGWFLLALGHSSWQPLLVLIVCNLRRWRGVLPLTLSGMLLFGYALLLCHHAGGWAFNREGPRQVMLAGVEHFGVQVVAYGPFFVAAIPVGLAVWGLLRFLAASYRRRGFSDIQLIADCWWLLVNCFEVTLLSVNLGLKALWALSAFGAYRITLALLMRLDRPKRQPAPAGVEPTLTLLRVFGFQRRTERLYDAVVQRWRFLGPVQMIGAPDIAAHTADPGDILCLIEGRLVTQFVRDAASLDDKLAGFDQGRDPDGRFRVNELHCHADTWERGLGALLNRSDRVLMDLRGFSADNLGCRFELQQLVMRFPRLGAVLVVDDTTDMPLLTRVLTEGASPERVDPGEALCMVRMARGGSDRELAAVTGALAMGTETLRSEPL